MLNLTPTSSKVVSNRKSWGRARRQSTKRSPRPRLVPHHRQEAVRERFLPQAAEDPDAGAKGDGAYDSLPVRLCTTSPLPPLKLDVADPLAMPRSINDLFLSILLLSELFTALQQGLVERIEASRAAEDDMFVQKFSCDRSPRPAHSDEHALRAHGLNG